MGITGAGDGWGGVDFMITGLGICPVGGIATGAVGGGVGDITGLATAGEDSSCVGAVTGDIAGWVGAGWGGTLRRSRTFFCGPVWNCCAGFGDSSADTGAEGAGKGADVTGIGGGAGGAGGGGGGGTDTAVGVVSGFVATTAGAPPVRLVPQLAQYALFPIVTRSGLPQFGHAINPDKLSIVSYIKH